jgi:hypothetical protein
MLIVVTACAACTPAAGRETTEAPASAQATTAPRATADAKPSPTAINAGSCSASPLIDEMEDGDSTIAEHDGRSGSWYTYADEDGSSIEPAPGGAFVMAKGGAQGSKYAARMHGRMGVGNVYVGMGLNFTANKQPYDVSCCTGISFWDRKQGDGTGSVRFKVGDLQTVPEGNVCDDCYNDLGFTSEWTRFELPFAKMTQQPNWGQRFDSLRPDAVLPLHRQSTTPASTTTSG